MNRWTREEFSEMAEISPKFLYDIETSKKGFSAETLFYISRAFSVSCEYILGGKNSTGCNSNVLDLINLFDESQMNLLSQVLMSIYEMSTKNKRI